MRAGGVGSGRIHGRIRRQLAALEGVRDDELTRTSLAPSNPSSFPPRPPAATDVRHWKTRTPADPEQPERGGSFEAYGGGWEDWQQGKTHEAPQTAAAS